MKKYTAFLSVILIAFSLCACKTDVSSATSEFPTSLISSPETESPETEAEPTVKQVAFTRNTLPVFDGSTAMIPLGEGILSVLLGESREEVKDLIDFHKTDEAYLYLEAKKSDILIAAEACDDVKEAFEEHDFKTDREPIAMEGLVFIVNVNNPVSSLTEEEIIKIYTGEITNWSEVGGEDKEIVAFQRTETSGSQVMMRKCVMKDVEMAEAPSENIPGEMGSLIESVAAYDNSSNAIGYTVYYYADSMEMAKGLKIIAVNGVTPCNETIKTGEYPFTNPYYCTIRSDAAENSPERLIFDWLVSEEGQKLVALEGYVPVLDY